MIKVDKEKRGNLINLILLLSYLGIQLFLCVHHEPWRDESQAWIIARNASFREILGLCSSEGHPFLWFFILKLCILAGVSFYYCSLISFVFMAAAAVLLLWKSPFHTPAKICILLSPIFFYYNAAFCRIYSVVVLLLVLLCIIWPERRERPIAYGLTTALLLQSHILITGIGIGCILEMLICDRKRSEKRHLAGIMIPLVSLICLILELRQTPESETYIRVTPEGMIGRIGFRPFFRQLTAFTSLFRWHSLPFGVAALLISFATALYFTVRFFRDRSFRESGTGVGIVSFCGAAVYWGIIFLVRNAGHIQMGIVFWMIMLFFTWTAVREHLPGSLRKGPEARSGRWDRYLNADKFEILFVLSCLLMIPKSAWTDPGTDIRGQYSGSREIVRQAEDLVPDDSVVALKNHFLSTSIAAFLYDSGKDLRIWDISNGCEFSIHKWGRPNLREPEAGQIYGLLIADLGICDNIFYIDGYQYPESGMQPDDKMVLIAANTELSRANENYILFRANK